MGAPSIHGELGKLGFEVAQSAWTIAALAILDWLDPVTTALDSLFVMVGSVRLSALLALKTLAFLLFGIWAAIAVSVSARLA